MPSSTRGRGRRPAADLAGLPWLEEPVHAVQRGWSVPGRAPAGPDTSGPALRPVDLWHCLTDLVTEARATSPASSTGSSSSGYSSYGDVSSSSADDIWREREVYASVKYESMGIDCTFNYWSPISEDDAVLDELQRRCQDLTPAELDQQDPNCDLMPGTGPAGGQGPTGGHGPTGEQEARGCSGPAFPREGAVSQNAPFAENDVLRRAAVVDSNRLDWGAAFYRWLPMPTLEEAILLARIAEAEEMELRRQSALKKAAKQRRYGTRRDPFSSFVSEHPGRRRGASTTVGLEFSEVRKNF